MITRNIGALVLRIRHSLRFTAVWVIALLYLSSAQSADQQFKIYTEDFPPYNYLEKGKITGISTEIVHEILRRVDHPDQIEIAAWSHAYQQTLNNDNTILYSTTRVPIREDLFKWVGPLVPNNTVFFSRTASGLSIKSLDDARKVGRIGVYMDDFGELMLKDAGFTNLRSVPDNYVNVNDLVDGKIDLWIINELTGNHMAREAGLAGKIEKVFEVEKEFMYLAFSKNTPDSVIDTWQAALDEIKADGTYAQIFSKWIMFSFSEDLKPTRQVKLSAEERAWINEHPTIRMATDPDYPPFQFTDKDGHSRGIANEYIKLMGKKLGISIVPVFTESWVESQSLVRQRKADLLAVAAETEARKDYLLFTQPYAQFPDVIVIRKNGSPISSLEELNGKSIASVPGFAINDFLKHNHPNINIIEKPDVQSLVRSVSTGEVDTAALNLATISYQVEKERITNLRVSGQTGFSYKLAIASRNDWPLLNQILEKALASISEEEIEDIDRKWVSLSEVPHETSEGTLTNLSHRELAWLADHPVISLAPDPAWPPVEFFDDDNTYAGMTADYVSLLEKKLGVQFKIHQAKNWEGVLSASRDRTIDVMTAAAATEERRRFLKFTKPYLHMPAVIIVNDKVKGTLTMQELKGKTVSVVSGYTIHQYIQDNYPDIIIDPVFNTAEGLRKVAFGKSDALIANVATAGYLIEKEVIQNLRIAGESGFTYNLSLASRIDWPVLNSVLNKGLESITRQERQAIFRKWVPIAEKPWISIKQLLTGLAVVISLIFVIGIVVWNRQLKDQVSQRTNELRVSEDNFRSLYKTALAGLFRTSIDGTELYTANPAFAKLFGYQMSEDFIKDFCPKDHYVDANRRKELVAILDQDGQVEEFEYLGKQLDGTERIFILNAYKHKDEKDEYIEGAILDITERKKSENIIRELAMTDPLTGLANRNRFNTKLHEAVDVSKRFEHMAGLLMVDLDDFKPVNDNYGHPVGDALLVHVANELKQVFREVDTVARIGGDEFSIILNGVKTKTDAVRLAEEILVRLSKPIDINTFTVHIGASIGLCFFPDDAKDIDDLLNKADKALYRAKEKGKNQICLHNTDSLVPLGSQI